MKTYLTMIAFLVLALFSCNKEENEDVTNPDATGGTNDDFQFVTTEGSYWVYQWYRIDANGAEEQMSRRDSIYIQGDTTLNGIAYVVYNGTLFPSSQDFAFYRDSTGYILNNYGTTAWSYVNFEDTLAENEVSPYWRAYSIMLESEDIITPSGEFSALRKQDRFYREDGELATSCGDQEIVFTSNFVSGVGLVQYQIGYIAPIATNCEFIEEARLVDYFIAP